MSRGAPLPSACSYLGTVLPLARAENKAGSSGEPKLMNNTPFTSLSLFSSTRPPSPSPSPFCTLQHPPFPSCRQGAPVILDQDTHGADHYVRARPHRDFVPLHLAEVQVKNKQRWRRRRRQRANKLPFTRARYSSRCAQSSPKLLVTMATFRGIVHAYAPCSRNPVAAARADTRIKQRELARKRLPAVQQHFFPKRVFLTPTHPRVGRS